MDLGLKDKSVIVLASSKGLGKATANQFASEGARVYLARRDEDALEKAAAEIREETGNPNVAYSVCDIKNDDSIKRLVAKAVSDYGSVDVLDNNAGGPSAGTFDNVGDDAWHHASELHLASPIRPLQ